MAAAMKMKVEKIFDYDDTATGHLCSRCEKMAAVIERVGFIERKVTPDVFESLASCIISQQISGKAAETVWARFSGLLGGEITPLSVTAADDGAMQKCGMSMRKVSYIKSAAQAAMDGRLPLSGLENMDDEEVIGILDALPGIGRWTAEMLMIFSLGRPDILSYDDLGIRKGLMRLHGLEAIPRGDFERFRALYSPYGSVASFYLWHIASEQGPL